MNEKDFIYMANLLFVNYKFVLYFQLGNNSFDRINIKFNGKGINVLIEIHI